MSQPKMLAWRLAGPAATMLAAALLAGCATESSKRGEAVAKSTSTSMDLMRVCLETVYATPDFEAARRHLPADMSQASLEQETDPGSAKDIEIAAVLKAHPQLQACRKTFLDRLTDATPTLVPIYALVFTLSETSLIEVIQKKKTWGDHVRDVKELERKANLEIVDESKKIGGGLSQDPKEVQARKDAAEKSLATYYQVEKSFSTLRRPIITRTN